MQHSANTQIDRGLLVGADTLVDSVGLILAAVTARALGMKILISRLDYYYLLLLNGGLRFDDLGVVSIDNDIKFLEEAISESERQRPVLRAARPDVALSEDTAALALVRVLEERQLLAISPYRHGAYLDGVNFVLTGDPDDSVADTRHLITLTSSEVSFVGDVLKTPWHDDYWRAELSYVSPTFLDRLLRSEIMMCQMWTRFMNLGIAVRDGCPVFSARSWTNQWLQALFDTTGRLLLSDTRSTQIGTMREALSLRPDRVTVEDIARFLDGGLAGALMEVYEEERRQLRDLVLHHRRQDFVLLLLSLAASPLKIVGPVLSVLVYLYQQLREGGDDRHS